MAKTAIHIPSQDTKAASAKAAPASRTVTEKILAIISPD
jgi:hypothetical protein